MQLVRALMKRDTVHLIEVDEVREHVGVFLVENTGKDTQWLIIDARVSNLHFLLRPGVSSVTSEELSRVEVALENDDVDPGKLSRLPGLHLGLADEKDAFRRFKISKLFSSFFFDLPEVEGQEVGAPFFGWTRVPLFQQPADGSYLESIFCQKAIEEAMCATLGLGEAEILQDTRSCVVPRPSDESHDTETSRRASKKIFYVYVDRMGVLGTPRMKVDEDLMMAELKSRGLDTHEEIVHSNTAIALGIHFDLRNMLVSVAPMRLWRLKQGLRWALRLSGSARKNMGGALGTHDLCGPAQTRCALCALCSHL